MMMPNGRPPVSPVSSVPEVNEQGQPVFGGIPLAFLPNAIGVELVPTAEGPAIILSIMLPCGKTVVRVDPDGAINVGEHLIKYAKAAKAGIVLPGTQPSPGQLIVPPPSAN